MAILHMRKCEIILVVFSFMFLHHANCFGQSAGAPHATSLSTPNHPQGENYSGALIIFKLDKQGNIIWTNSYGGSETVNNYLSAVVETNDKGFVLDMGSVPNGINPSFLSIIKIDQQGSFTWGRKLGMEDNATYNIGGVVEKNGFIYATGSIYENMAPYSLLRSFLVQLEGTTGATNWTVQNNPAQPALRFTDLHNYETGLMLNSSNANDLTALLLR